MESNLRGVSMDDARRRLSRFQVRCEGRPAWAVDARDRRFYFDGLRFWAVRASTSRVKPAWQSPGHGWVHEEACRCALCAEGEGEELRQIA
jgi:hypothetical protein